MPCSRGVCAYWTCLSKLGLVHFLSLTSTASLGSDWHRVQGIRMLSL